VLQTGSRVVQTTRDTARSGSGRLTAGLVPRPAAPLSPVVVVTGGNGPSPDSSTGPGASIRAVGSSRQTAAHAAHRPRTAVLADGPPAGSPARRHTAGLTLSDARGAASAPRSRLAATPGNSGDGHQRVPVPLPAPAPAPARIVSAHPVGPTLPAGLTSSLPVSLPRSGPNLWWVRTAGPRERAEDPRVAPD
jgi:hypothetical protein